MLLGDMVIGVGHGGGVSVWVKGAEEEEEEDLSSSSTPPPSSSSSSSFLPYPGITGHFGPVTDVAWDQEGTYLLTGSSDHTVRMWCPVNNNNNTNNNNNNNARRLLQPWIECARPQCHGHPITSVSALPGGRYVSGSAEKFVRTFRITRDARVRRGMLAGEGGRRGEEEEGEEGEMQRAYTPSLGLSNKGGSFGRGEEVDLLLEGDVDSAGDGNGNGSSRPYATDSVVPTERDLGVLTLWPETGKMYGHGNDVVRVKTWYAPSARAPTPSHTHSDPSSSSSSSTLLPNPPPPYTTTTLPQPVCATSCKSLPHASPSSSSSSNNSVLLWSVLTGSPAGRLSGGHDSTVTAIDIAGPAGGTIVTGGKDRRICLWVRTGEDIEEDGSRDGNHQQQQLDSWTLAASVPKAHKRIIWSASISTTTSSPSLFATSSRDGTVKLWRIRGGGCVVREKGGGKGRTREIIHEHTVEFGASVNVVRFGPWEGGAEGEVNETTKGAEGTVDGGNTLAIGLENGDLEFMYLSSSSSSTTTTSSSSSATLTSLPSLSLPSIHSGAITSLEWSPRPNDDGGRYIATGGRDEVVRVFEVRG